MPSAFLTVQPPPRRSDFINCTASIGGFVGPKIIGNLSQRSGGSFDGGFIFMIACWTIAAVLVLALPSGASGVMAAPGGGSDTFCSGVLLIAKHLVVGAYLDMTAVDKCRFEFAAVLDPQSPEARAIYHLAIVSGIIFAIIFVIVAGIILYALMRFRWREGDPDPINSRGTRRSRSLDRDSVSDRAVLFPLTGVR